eukprot:snap_masked-scaffold_1-processed-gene-4.28-mRNA-1 protein AED:0.13 eAED:0.15 QI:0/-1/0/1/-1/1/1/0/216
MSFSEILKDGSKGNHRDVGTTLVMKRLADRTLSKEEYKHLLARYYFIYNSLEAAVHKVMKTNELVKSFHFKELDRLDPLVADIKFFFGENFEEDEVFAIARDSPATKAWVDTIETVEKEDPDKLVAHMYVRYLGDLFGGQVIGEKVRKGLSVGDEGSNFYRFEQIKGSPMAMVKQFKVALDMIVDPKLQEIIIDETNKSYELQFDILSDVDRYLEQ